MSRWTRTGRIVIIAVVAAMHVFFWRLLIVEIKPAFSPAEARLTVSLIVTPPRRTGRPRSASRGMVSKEHGTPLESKRPSAKPPFRHIWDQSAPEVLLRSPIDWEQALHSGAQDRISRSGRQRTLTFGFPKSASSSLSDRGREWDGWDFAATHRIGLLPRGGMLIRLNDHCSIVFVPLPLFGCLPGKIETNDDLFKDLPKARFGKSTMLP